MGGFPQGYWYLLMVAGKPGPKKDEEITAVLQPVINTVRVCSYCCCSPSSSPALPFPTHTNLHATLQYTLPLLPLFHSQADKQGLPCYTEVTEEKNLPVLERLGFVVTAQASLFGVQYFVLLRQARKL